MTSMNEVTVIDDWYYGSSQDEYNQNMQSDSALVVEMPCRYASFYGNFSNKHTASDVGVKLP